MKGRDTYMYCPSKYSRKQCSNLITTPDDACSIETIACHVHLVFQVGGMQ